MQFRSRPRQAFRFALVFFLIPACLSGCREAGTALGPSPGQARANADSLFFALGARFGPAQGAPGFEALRTKFARSALVPSRIYDDSTLWSSFQDETRLLEFGGRPTPSGYRLGLREEAGTPRDPGEYRRSTRLHRLARDEYHWTIRDELAVGGTTPDALGAALAALLASAEHADAKTMRTLYRSALPGATAALGRLFTLDSLALVPAPLGGTRVTLSTTLHARDIADEFPLFARFLQRYAGPLRFDLEVRDLQGARWWTATKSGDRLALHLRVHDGRLAPLDGPPRRMPDQLRVHADVATRIRIFGIRIADLVGDVTLTRTPGVKAFSVRFRQEPDWHLPPLVERLIRTPLRRPFEGNGALLSLSARSAAGRTLLVRDYQITVQESAILRWFGGLGNTALGDFRNGAEPEYERFVGEVFTALRTDAHALIR